MIKPQIALRIREENRAIVRSVRMAQRIWRRLTFRNGCRYTAFLVVAGLLAIMLSGCMEALQNGQVTRSLPPPAIPAPTVRAAAVAGVPIPTEMTAAIPTPTSQETPTPVDVQTSSIPETTFVLSTPLPLSSEQRWRTQQISRTIFDHNRSYATASSELWWYDPVNQQHVILGTFTGNFLAQAQFTLRGQGVEALEVPYNVNVSYGLTALSPALVARVRAAGGKDWIETYVFITPNVAPR